MDSAAFRRYSLCSLAVLGLGLASTPAGASAWTKSKGDLSILMPLSYTHVDESFDEDGDRVDRPVFELAEISPLIQYGVTDSFTIGMQPKYRRVWLEDANGDVEHNSGLAETDFFLRQRLWSSGDASLSLQAGVKVPVDPEEDSDVPLGRDQVDADLKLAYGNRHAAGSGRIFYSAETGYNKRWQLPSDEAFFNAFIGWAPGGSAWSFILRSANTVSVGNEDNNDSEVLTAFPDYNRHEAQLMASYRFDNSLSLTGGVSNTFAGESVGIGKTWFLALSVPYEF